MTIIQRLDPHLINQIAAGEVIERPAAIIKELVENALDATATKITITIENGGKSFLEVVDNGYGMMPDDLPLAFERHATSKLSNADLFKINTFGFRGEAIPSIAAISKVRCVSYPREENHAHEYIVEGGKIIKHAPCNGSYGTCFQIRDLFFATPARLRFLKSDTTETNHIKDTVMKLALANPKVAFVLKTLTRNIFDWPNTSPEQRIAQVIGQDFIKNSTPVLLERDGYQLHGFAGLPVYSRSNAQDQHLFVNNRWIRDRQLISILRAAYQDQLMAGRYPMVVLFLTLPMDEVDVNVHPCKTEVRFQDPQRVRSIIIQGLKQALSAASQQTPEIMQHMAMNFMSGKTATGQLRQANQYTAKINPSYQSPVYQAKPIFRTDYNHKPMAGIAQLRNTEQPVMLAAEEITPKSLSQDNPQDFTQDFPQDFPMGASKAQIFNTFIIAQNADEMIIVDQHAAHERIVYEDLKKQWASSKIAKQPLISPAYVNLKSPQLLDVYDTNKELILAQGFTIDSFAPQTLVVHAQPAICHLNNLESFFNDLLDDMAEVSDAAHLQEKLWKKLASYACHHSIRAGKTLSLEEMNVLLRQMEQTERSQVCNHGRPTFVKLTLKDLEKLFDR